MSESSVSESSGSVKLNKSSLEFWSTRPTSLPGPVVGRAMTVLVLVLVKLVSENVVLVVVSVVDVAVPVAEVDVPVVVVDVELLVSVRVTVVVWLLEVVEVEVVAV